MMDPAGSSKTPQRPYQTMRCHIPENRHIYGHSCDNFQRHNRRSIFSRCYRAMTVNVWYVRNTAYGQVSCCIQGVGVKQEVTTVTASTWLQATETDQQSVETLRTVGQRPERRGVTVTGIELPNSLSHQHKLEIHYIQDTPVPVAVRSKTLVCGR
jgi:hypothetical protein